MDDFNRKVEDASARVSKTVAEAAERIEKEIPGIHQVPERRGRPHRAPALDQGVADSQPKAHRTGGLHGATKGFEKVKVKLRSAALLDSALILLLLTILLVFLTGCGHPKQTPLNVPPPPQPALAESPAPPHPRSAAKNNRTPAYAKPRYSKQTPTSPNPRLPRAPRRWPLKLAGRAGTVRRITTGADRTAKSITCTP